MTTRYGGGKTPVDGGRGVRHPHPPMGNGQQQQHDRVVSSVSLLLLHLSECGDEALASNLADLERIAADLGGLIQRARGKAPAQDVTVQRVAASRWTSLRTELLMMVDGLALPVSPPVGFADRVRDYGADRVIDLSRRFAVIALRDAKQRQYLTARLWTRGRWSVAMEITERHAQGRKPKPPRKRTRLDRMIDGD